MIIGPQRNQASPTIPPKIDLILRFFDDSEEKKLMKNMFPFPNNFFLNTLGLFIFSFQLTETLQEKKLYCNYIRFYKITFSWFQFWTLGSDSTRKCMKVKMHESMSFLDEALPKFKHWI